MIDKKQQAQSAYQLVDEKKSVSKCAIALLVDNESGVLGRVIGLFSARGYNLESVTVNEVDHEKGLSRITLITRGNDEVIALIMALLERLVPVHEVHNLTLDSPHIEREVGMIKVVNEDCEGRASAQKLADRFGARTIDSTPESFIFELSDTSEKIDKFIHLMEPHGIREICRTGVTAIARGTEGFKY